MNGQLEAGRGPARTTGPALLRSGVRRLAHNLKLRVVRGTPAR